MGPITTEIAEAGAYYPAEDYHQQYLHKNPGWSTGGLGGHWRVLPGRSGREDGVEPVRARGRDSR